MPLRSSVRREYGDDGHVHRRTALGTIASLSLLGGCLRRPRTDPGAEALERLDGNERELEGVSGRVRLERVVDGERTETRLADLWSEPGGRIRQEVDGDRDAEEMTVVAADDGTWIHFPDAGAAANLDFRVEYAGAYPFEYGAVLDHPGAYDVESRGREELAGRTAERVDCRAVDPDDLPKIEYYSFRIGPEMGAGYAPERVEFWIDEEFGVPLGRSVHTSDVRSTVRFEEVALDRPIPPDRLTFDPPPDVEVLDWAKGFVDNHETVEQAQAHAGFAFGFPERVDGYELDVAAVVYMERGTGLQGHYLPEDASVEVGDDAYPEETIAARTWGPGVGHGVEGERTTVAGRDAAIDRDDGVRLAFDCGDHGHEIAGSDEDAVRTIAGAVDCERRR